MNEHIYMNQFFIRNLTLKKKRKSYAEEINVSKTLIVKCWACDKPVVHLILNMLNGYFPSNPSSLSFNFSTCWHDTTRHVLQTNTPILHGLTAPASLFMEGWSGAPSSLFGHLIAPHVLSLWYTPLYPVSNNFKTGNLNKNNIVLKRTTIIEICSVSSIYFWERNEGQAILSLITVALTQGM